MFLIQAFPNKSFLSCNTVKLCYCFAPGYHTMRMSSRLVSTGNHKRQKKKEDVGTAASSQSTVEHKSKPTILRFQLGKSRFRFWTLKSNFVQVTGLSNWPAGLFLRSVGSVMNWRLVTGGSRWAGVPPLASRKRLRGRQPCRNCADCLY